MTTPTTTSGERLLYVNSSNELIFNNGSAAVTLGAAGAAAGTPTLDAIYAGDKTMTIGSGTLTLAGNASTADDVLTITNVSGSSGRAIQITNSTTSNADIRGTSGTWQVLGTGVATFEEATIDGTEGSNVFTVTKGDVRFLDSALAVTDDDNAASFTVTNDTATTASVNVFAGSGAFTGSTTSSWMTITPSGLTTGTAVYLPVAALTTGKAVHIVANAVTDGLVLNVTSSSTVHTATGRLLAVASTALTNTSAVLNEFSTAANDETVLLRLTASDILAAGKILHLSASSMTTGTAIDGGALDALTTGMGLSLASSSLTLTSGSLIRVSTATTGAVATNGIVSITATAAYTSTSNAGLLQVVADSVTTGATIVNVSGTAATTSVVMRLASTGTGLTSGSVLLATTGTTGAIATNGAFSFTGTGAFTVGAATLGMFHVAGNSTTAGTVASFQGNALTTGVAVAISDTGTGMTSGSLLRIATASTGAVATNGVVSISATGAYTSTSNAGLLDVVASGTTAGTVVRIRATAAAQTATELLNVTASGYTTGYTGNVVSLTGVSTTGASNLLALTSANSTAGNALSITANSLTTGTAVLVTSSGTITSSSEGLVNLVATGMTTGSALKIDLTEATLTTGKYINCYDDTGATSVFSVAENGAILFSDLTEVVTGTNTITADESGSVFFLNSVTEFVSTLPAPVAGMHFTFICTAAPSGASYTITTNASSNIVLGTVHSSDGVDGDSELVGADTVNFVDGAAKVGDSAEFWCDGTNWFVKCHCDISTGMTITTAS